jgi:hypothetical protein
MARELLHSRRRAGGLPFFGCRCLPGCRRLVDQFTDFPIAEHDDGPDAPELCCRLPVEVKRLR